MQLMNTLWADVPRRTCQAILACVLMLCCVPANAGQVVVVVLDDSGSMDQSMGSRVKRMAAAKQSLESVLRNLPFDTRVGILTLNSTVKGSHWLLPVGSPDPNRWSSLLKQIRAKGGTPLGQMMKEGADELLKMRAQEPFETYRLLVVTDGEATDGPFLAAILPDLISRGITLDVIGVAMKQQHSLANIAHTYRAAGDAESLTNALSEVFAETGSDDQAAQADFDLISGMPDDVASEIVKSLSTPRNDPITQVSLTPGAGDPVAASGAGPPFSPSQPANQNPSSTRVGSAISAILSTICCFGSFCFVTMVVVAIILNAVKNHTQS